MRSRRHRPFRGLRRLVLPAVTLALIGVVPSGVTGTASAAQRVIIVSIPGVTWEDVTEGRTPVLGTLAEDHSMGAMSVRTVGSRTDLASAYATLGAGNRARVSPTAVATTLKDEDGGLRVAGFELIAQDNEDLRFGAEVGALGEAVREAGLPTAVVGNADGGELMGFSEEEVPTEQFRRRRYASLALADASGSVGAGAVGKDLVLEDEATTSGYRTNTRALLREFDALVEEGVVLVELADTFREGAVLYSRAATEEAADESHPARVAALRRDDRLLGEVLERVDLRRESLLVLGTAGPGPRLRERLTVAVLAGVTSGESAWLTSPTTRREGIVALTDIGPGVLELLQLPVPESMTGQPLRAAGAGEARIQRLVRLQSAALFHDRWVTTFFAVLVLLQLVVVFAGWRVLRRQATARWVPGVRGLALGVMSVPVATFFAAGLRAHEWGLWGPPVVILVGAAAIAAGASRGPWRDRRSGPVAFVCAVMVIIIGADVATGSRLQLSSLVGYSPIVAGRFYGIGNLAFAVLGTSAALLAGALAGSMETKRAVAVVLAVGAVAVAVDGLPWMGADFGGVLALLPAFGVMALLLSSRGLSWLRILALLGAAAAVAVAMAFLDYLRAPEVQTHLGRFAGRLVTSGVTGIWEVILRKAEANLSLLTRSVLSLMIPVAAVFAWVVVRRRKRQIMQLLTSEAGLKAGLAGAATVNLIGFAVNDSGIAIPAMGLGIAVPYLLVVVLGPSRPAEG